MIMAMEMVNSSYSMGYKTNESSVNRALCCWYRYVIVVFCRSGNCELRQATLLLYSDGRYKLTAVLRNNSEWPDAGDVHRMNLEIMSANNDIVHAISWRQWMLRGEERVQISEGDSREIMLNFDQLRTYMVAIMCRE